MSAGVHEPDGAPVPVDDPDPAAAPPSSPGPRRPRSWLREQFGPWIELVVVVALAFGVAYVIQLVAVKPYKIPTGSMIPTLGEGDRVLVARFWYRVNDVHRGDIVVFHPPATVDGDGLPGVSSQNYIKRAIGLPGDTVGSVRGHVYVCTSGPPRSTRTPLATAGCAQLAEPYVHGQWTGSCDAESAGSDFGPVTLATGRYFMMGDNRTNSDDSRCFGTIGAGQIVGRAFTTYWPPTRVGWLG